MLIINFGNSKGETVFTQQVVVSDGIGTPPCRTTFALPENMDIKTVTVDRGSRIPPITDDERELLNKLIAEREALIAFLEDQGIMNPMYEEEQDGDCKYCDHYHPSKYAFCPACGGSLPKEVDCSDDGGGNPL